MCLGRQQVVMTISEEEVVGTVTTCPEEEEEEETQSLVEAEEVLQFLVEEDFQHLKHISHFIINKCFKCVCQEYGITIDNFMNMLQKSFVKQERRKKIKEWGEDMMDQTKYLPSVCLDYRGAY